MKLSQNMYAIIQTGGKQYRVTEGQHIKVEKIDAAPGEEITFNQVLMIAEDGKDPRIGNPYLEQAKVKAKICVRGRGKKISILKFQCRKHHMKQQGHRQSYTEVEITVIQ
jgi:large subunit ribosomal protein L21